MTVTQHFPFHRQTFHVQGFRLIVFALTKIETGQTIHRAQSVEVTVTQHFLPRRQTLHVQGFSQIVFAFKPIETGQTIHRTQGIEVTVTQHFLFHRQTLHVQRFRQIVLALLLIEISQIVHRTQGVGVTVTQHFLPHRQTLHVQGFRQIVFALILIEFSRVVQRAQSGGVTVTQHFLVCRQTLHVQGFCQIVLALTFIQMAQRRFQSQQLDRICFLHDRLHCDQHNPISQLFKHHGIDTRKSYRFPYGIENAITVFGFPAFAHFGIDCGQHVVNGRSSIFGHILKKMRLVCLTHGDFKFAFLAVRRAIQFKQTPTTSQWNGVIPGSQYHDGTTKHFNGRFEGIAPPKEIQVHSFVLIIAEQIKPDNNVRFIFEMIIQRIHHVQKMIFPCMRNENRGDAHSIMALRRQHVTIRGLGRKRGRLHEFFAHFRSRQSFQCTTTPTFCNELIRKRKMNSIFWKW